jgi:hypothetical protein
MGRRIRPAAKDPKTGRFIKRMEVDLFGEIRPGYFCDLQAPEAVAPPIPGWKGRLGTWACIALGVGP